ncbi:hypothetical protein CPLU01_07090 [Colletotrichum plurivorum]|uniref:Uncharacterized protein n=1 Tax=Colletotrichum plurivorum TaxID=2175906 RepID=A0A8H6KGZ8_9PEZI|nr:hypothetical protein CPLU01_07090 [Colletotrichum plurivorum]
MQKTRNTRMSSVPTRSVSVPHGQKPIPLARDQTTPGHGEPRASEWAARASHPFRAVPQDCITPKDPVRMRMLHELSATLLPGTGTRQFAYMCIPST